MARLEFDRNCLRYWFPKLVDAGIPVPRTEIVKTTCDLIQILDCQKPDGYDAFIAELRQACLRINANGPWFLRTGQGSGKHDWNRTCNLVDLDKLPLHVAALVNWSAIVDFFGLAHDVWAVRERLPVDPITNLPGYSEMPLVAEIRAFVKDGDILCRHEYWPVGSIKDGLRDRKKPVPPHEELAKAQHLHANLITRGDYDQTQELTERVAKAFANDGAWSVDLLKTRNGWYVTDMADAAMSYHVPECPNAAISES